MASFCNSSLLTSKTSQTVWKGILVEGTFRDGTTFDGPGRLKFECEIPIGNRWIILWSVVLLSIVGFVAMFAWRSGQNSAAMKMSKCENEQDRTKQINDLMWKPRKEGPDRAEVSSLDVGRLSLVDRMVPSWAPSCFKSRSVHDMSTSSGKKEEDRKPGIDVV